MAISSAIGIIEVLGLTAGISVADAALKAANVRLLGYEVLPGFGWVNIKICGDVGAVNAAVAAGTAAASLFSAEYCKLVIPRPHEDTMKLVNSILHPMKPDPEVSSAFTNEKKEEKESGEDTNATEMVMEKSVPEEAEVTEAETEEVEGAEVEEAVGAEAEEAVETEVEEAKAEKAEETEEAAEAEEAEANEAEKAVVMPVPREATCNLCNDVNCLRKRGQPRKLCIHYSDKK